jgi:hypothetical protein
MSSKSSAICPQCRERRLLDQQEHEQRVAKAYGNVCREAYEQIKRQKPLPLEAETMGEYYEWEFKSDGVFWFHLHFACDVCGFNWKHSGEVDYPLKAKQ